MRRRPRQLHRRLVKRRAWLAVFFVLLLAAVGVYQFLILGVYQQNRPAPKDDPSIASNDAGRPAGRAPAALEVAVPTSADGTLVPRTIVALYNSQNSPQIRDTIVHRVAEMPLNHLGLTVEYRDLAAGLPQIAGRNDVRGVLAWLEGEDVVDAAAYYAWADAVLQSGIRYVVMGDVIRGRDAAAQAGIRGAANRFYQRLGVRLTDDYVTPTYDVKIVDQDPEVAAFERGFSGPLPAFDRFEASDAAVQTHLTLRQADLAATDSDLVVTGPNGGLVAAGYGLAEDRGTELLRWRINPFAFFSLAFDTDAVPKPDVTTLSGRRIYYSHIDGDGWLSLSTVDRYRDQGVIAAEVIHRQAIEPYPDLPVTVAPIAADIDPRWLGTENARRVARELFLLPQVEAGSHTYSHPFDWEWFAEYRASAEIPFLRKYFPDAARNSLIGSLFGREQAGYDQVVARYDAGQTEGEIAAPLEHVYETPRAYGNFPYQLATEISGAADFIGALLPPGKRVEVVQWSGNTMPYEAAIEATRRAGMRNLNGGDSRFDPRFPSTTSVPPVGRPVGSERQIYASASNENTYTALWTDRFYGFQLLTQTLDNTETPIRLKPFNIYYHMYSGEKQPALNALLANLEYARASELAPVTTSTYAAIGDGFYSTRIVELGERRWRIEGRDGLQTIRFDDADNLAVDFSRSIGIVGQRHTQGSLYIALDSAIAAPIVALRERSGDAAESDDVHLIHGRWAVTRLQHNEAGFTFLTQGFGAGEMAWRARPNAPYTISAEAEGREVFRETGVADQNGILSFTIDAAGIDPLAVRVARQPSREG